MPTYIYKAKVSPQQVIDGTMTADSASAVIARLSDQGYFPISVEEEHKSTTGVTLKKIKISQKDVGLFTRQLSDLLEGGLSLYQALDTLSKQTANKTFARVIQSIRDRVKEGNTLSDTLQEYPKIFEPLYVSMVRSGETGGMLDSVLVRLSEFSEKNQELRSKVKSALVYPMFLACFGVLTVTVLIGFVVPKLTGIFSDFGQALPLPTRILIGVSHFIGKWWWGLALFFVAVAVVVRQQGRTVEGRLMFDKLRLRLPVVGGLTLAGEFAGFSRTLSALFESGVPVLKALSIVTETLGNEVLRKEMKTINEKISKGSSLGVCMEESPYFPLVMTNMIKIGEKSGSVEKSLLKVADSYDKEVERMTRAFTTLIEPILILSLGLVVGCVVISMLLPIFNINLAVK